MVLLRLMSGIKTPPGVSILVDRRVAEDLLVGFECSTEQVRVELLEASMGERGIEVMPSKSARSQWGFWPRRRACV